MHDVVFVIHHAAEFRAVALQSRATAPQHGTGSLHRHSGVQAVTVLQCYSATVLVVQRHSAEPAVTLPQRGTSNHVGTSP